jgi:hypothetical protein
METISLQLYAMAKKKKKKKKKKKIEHHIWRSFRFDITTCVSAAYQLFCQNLWVVWLLFLCMKERICSFAEGHTRLISLKKEKEGTRF